MKAFITSCILLVSICLFSGIHSVTMTAAANNILSRCEQVLVLAESDNWEAVVEEIDNIQTMLKKKRIWSTTTISAKNIEETQTALNKSRVFAVLGQKPDFFGEFILFQDLICRISVRESLSLGELL